MRSYTTADLSDAYYDIIGHQNLTDNSHTDPGKYWDWARYYSLINPTSGTTTILDSFESSVGHFVTSPTYSGSTTGVSTASTAKRNCSIRHNGRSEEHTYELQSLMSTSYAAFCLKK